MPYVKKAGEDAADITYELLDGRVLEKLALPTFDQADGVPRNDPLVGRTE